MRKEIPRMSLTLKALREFNNFAIDSMRRLAEQDGLPITHIRPMMSPHGVLKFAQEVFLSWSLRRNADGSCELVPRRYDGVPSNVTPLTVADLGYLCGIPAGVARNAIRTLSSGFAPLRDAAPIPTLHPPTFLAEGSPTNDKT